MVERVVSAFTVWHIDCQPYIIRLQFYVDDAMARFDIDCMAVREAYFDQLSKLGLQKFAKDDARVELPLSDLASRYVESLQFQI